MGLFIDNIAERISSGAVGVKKNGDGFLITSKKFCQFTGAEKDEEYETLTLEIVDNQKKQEESAIKNLNDQKNSMLQQIEAIDRDIQLRTITLPNFDFLSDYLKNFDGAEKTESKKGSDSKKS